MSNLTVQNGSLVVRGDALGTEQACCCSSGDPCCYSESWPPALPTQADRGLVWLEFSACIGSGAEATVDAPQAASLCDYESQAGPISGATLTNGGSGYAIFGRVSPTVSAAVAGGSGATFSVTLEEQTTSLNGCLDVAYWRVSSVAVTDGGSGYSDNASVTFSVASGDTVVQHAKAYAYVVVDEPNSSGVTIDSVGTGAVLVPTWEPTTPTIGRGGASNPPFCTKPGRATYKVSGLTVTSGGSGYSVDDSIEITFATTADGTVANIASIFVDAVDGNGAITAVRVDNQGRYGGAFTGELSEVVVESCVGSTGHYYREDASVAPYVATVIVSVEQESPSTGSGAIITATVEDDTASADFGKIVALSVSDGGSGYLQPPAACSLPDKLYITFAGANPELYNTEVPTRDAQEIGLVCQSSEDVQFTGAGTFCLDGPCLDFTTSPTVGGATASAAAASISEPLSCRCDGALYLTVTIEFRCFECGPEEIDPVTGLPRCDPPRINLFRVRTLCMKFEVDESGCPVGDAQLAEPTTADREIYEACGAQEWQCIGCFHHESVEVCPCDSTCDTLLVPTISLMP